MSPAVFFCWLFVELAMPGAFFEAQRLHREGDLAAAERAYQLILFDDPNAAEALHYLGLLYLGRSSDVGAEGLLLKSLCLAPAVGAFWSNAATALQAKDGRFSVAWLAERGVLLRPQAHDARHILSAVLKQARRLEAALFAFCHAIALAPSDFDVLLSAAAHMKALGKWTSALKHYDWCLRLKPGEADVVYSKAHCYLSLGIFSAGWEAYEQRFAATVNASHAAKARSIILSKPSWRPQLTSLRVLVWAEQGIGDEIMFGGLLGEFRDLCSDIIVKIDARLLSLFARSFPNIKFIPHYESLHVDLYDAQLPMGSMARILRRDLCSFENSGYRYLYAPRGLAEHYRRGLRLNESVSLIGLSWRSESPDNGADRSIDLLELMEELLKISANKALKFVNLQYGDVRTEIDEVRSKLGIEIISIDGVNNRDQLDLLAGVIEACDDVVSIGNTTAHLAGALGKRTWVLLPKVAGWRWLSEGRCCLWYRSVTVIRQNRHGDWSSVLSELVEVFR